MLGANRETGNLCKVLAGIPQRSLGVASDGGQYGCADWPGLQTALLWPENGAGAERDRLHALGLLDDLLQQQATIVA